MKKAFTILSALMLTQTSLVLAEGEEVIPDAAAEAAAAEPAATEAEPAKTEEPKKEEEPAKEAENVAEPEEPPHFDADSWY